MKVYSKLNAARKEFHTLKLQKTGLNKFAGYNYFELSDFLIPALSTFDKHGLCAFVSFGEAVATMKVVDVEDGSFIELTSPMAEANLKGCHPIQNLGAVETYTRRYLWVSALEIVEHDALDSSAPLSTDGNAASKPRARQPEPEIDLSPKARAIRINQGVKDGDAENAAAAMSGWDAGLIDSVWTLLDKATQDKLTAHWPKV
jgi:hypothetical protein